MKLKSFGCSFIFGSELQDDGYGSEYATASKFTWPALLANKFNLEYECFAKPGSGNTRIAEQVLNQIETQEPAVYVIGWTWIERFDYIDRTARDSWNSINAWSTSDAARNYYQNIHSQYYDKLASLMSITLVQTQLEKLGCRYFMTYMDDLLFETQYHHSNALQLMQSQLKPCLHNFDGLNFLEWSRKHGYPVGQRGQHPLEQAHAAACKYVLKNHSF